MKKGKKIQENQAELEKQHEEKKYEDINKHEIEGEQRQEAQNDEESKEEHYQPEKQVVVFELDNQQYAIDIIQVYEMERLKEIVISPVPKAPEFVEGIINLRGEAVPVINLRKKLGIEQKEIDKRTRIIIVKLENKVIGLLVDGVSEVVDITESSISLPPDEITDISTRYLTGVAKVENRIILLLNINEILTTDE